MITVYLTSFFRKTSWGWSSIDETLFVVVCLFVVVVCMQWSPALCQTPQRSSVFDGPPSTLTSAGSLIFDPPCMSVLHEPWTLIVFPVCYLPNDSMNSQTSCSEFSSLDQSVVSSCARLSLWPLTPLPPCSLMCDGITLDLWPLQSWVTCGPSPAPPPGLTPGARPVLPVPLTCQPLQRSDWERQRAPKHSQFFIHNQTIFEFNAYNGQQMRVQLQKTNVII